MKLPHWLWHRWGDWKPNDTGSLLDVRTCVMCGRRQMRLI